MALASTVLTHPSFSTFFLTFGFLFLHHVHTPHQQQYDQLLLHIMHQITSFDAYSTQYNNSKLPHSLLLSWLLLFTKSSFLPNHSKMS